MTPFSRRPGPRGEASTPVRPICAAAPAAGTAIAPPGAGRHAPRGSGLARDSRIGSVPWNAQRSTLPSPPLGVTSPQCRQTRGRDVDWNPFRGRQRLAWRGPIRCVSPERSGHTSLARRCASRWCA